MLIDTHAHINFNYFKDDGDKIIQKTLDENVWMINVGADYKTSKRALEYANKYEKGVYAAVGLHPIHIVEMETGAEDYEFKTRGEEFNYDIYEKLAKFEKAVAIGEIGLDYYHIGKGFDPALIKDAQKKVFYEQLLLARLLDLPVIIHCRQAHDDMLAVLKEFRREHPNLFLKNKAWGVMHCFSGDEDLAWQYFGLGLLISFTGLITFSRQWDDLIRKLPNDKFMVETDCPFMTPEPFRGQRNEPLLVEYVARRIAEIKGIKFDNVADISTENAKNLFRLE
jgi:TatD DNase family protein